MDKKETTRSVVRSPSFTQSERAKPKDTVRISNEQQDELLADMETTVGPVRSDNADDDVELEIVVDEVAEPEGATDKDVVHSDPDKR